MDSFVVYFVVIVVGTVSRYNIRSFVLWNCEMFL